jgi:ribosome-binding ATPase YchF (GTP1/OBG family)
LLLLVNTAESAYDPAVVQSLSEAGYQVVTAPLGLEIELQSLDPAEQAEFAAELGITGSSRERLLRAIFDVTEQITFFTSDEKEVHAWLLKRGSTAVEAAAAIHTDLARGFIRAEVMAVDDLLRLGSEREVKAQNLYHLVGKEHIIQDGDEVVIRSGV